MIPKSVKRFSERSCSNKKDHPSKRGRPRSCDRGLPTDGAVPGIRPNRISCWRLHIVGALAVIGEIEAFALALNGRTQADRVVDLLVDDQRADTRPDQR